MRTDAVLGGGGSPADPDFDQYLTLNSALTGDGFNNMARYDNPAVDKALLEGRRSGDPAVRKGAYDTVQRLPWGPMARMPGRRILFAGPVLLVVTFGVFAVAARSPFDPVKAYAGAAGLTASQTGLDQLRASLGADQPLLERWWEWLASALTGDLGTSAVMRRRAHRPHRRLRPPRPRPPEPRPRRIPRTARPQWLRQVHPGRGRRAAAPARPGDSGLRRPRRDRLQAPGAARPAHRGRHGVPAAPAGRRTPGSGCASSSPNHSGRPAGVGKSTQWYPSWRTGSAWERTSSAVGPTRSARPAATGLSGRSVGAPAALADVGRDAAMLDASTTAALVGVVEECRAESGAGLLAVGHDPVLLARWCGRTVRREEIVKD